MKRFTFVSFFVFITIFSFGQWQSNFGIGVEKPNYKLDIDGDVNISSGHHFLIDGIPLSDVNNIWQNTSSDTIYFKGKAVGIGTDAPTEKLTIEGTSNNISGRTFLKLQNNSTDSHSCVNFKLYAGSSSSFTILTHHSNTYTATDNLGEVGQLWNQGNGLLLRSSGAGLIRFETDLTPYTVERMRINDEGNVGINTTAPTEKLEVNGNILIKNNNALILTSPNGTEYKITVDDSGNLITHTMTSYSSIATETVVNIFPNPTNNILTVNIKDLSFQNVDAEIYTVSGKMIHMKTYYSNSFNINTTDLRTGNYILKLKTETGEILKTEKFIKR